MKDNQPAGFGIGGLAVARSRQQRGWLALSLQTALSTSTGLTAGRATPAVPGAYDLPLSGRDVLNLCEQFRRSVGGENRKEESIQ